MKLLPKNEIVKLKEQEKAREAQEGLKVARRVDALRETEAATKKQLDDFRNASLEAIGKEIRKADEEKKALQSEIIYLQLKLDAMLPGMETKREELDKKEKALKKLSTELEDLKEKLRLEEIDLYELKNSREKALKAAETSRNEADWLKNEAQNKEREASQTLLRAQSLEQSIQKEKSEQNKAFTEKEGFIAYRERELNAFEERLKQKDADLEKERIKLADRQAMVARTLERLKQNRINVDSSTG